MALSIGVYLHVSGVQPIKVLGSGDVPATGCLTLASDQLADLCLEVFVSTWGGNFICCTELQEELQSRATCS